MRAVFNKCGACVALALLLQSGVVGAYEVGTHETLSGDAAAESVISGRLGDLGLDVLLQDPLLQEIDDYSESGSILFGKVHYCIPRLSVGKRTVIGTIGLGAFCEDLTFGEGQPTRYLLHFYDPAHGGQGLNGVPPLDSSLVWSINATNNIFQTYALGNAKNYLQQAITATDASIRSQARWRFLRTLGHLMHLIQDIAQPQHTRDDPHGGGSPYEKYVEKFIGTLPVTQYDPVKISQWNDLWSTSVNAPQLGRGLADFSNSEFVSQGRNFRGTPQNVLANGYQPFPTGAGAGTEDVAASTLPCMLKDDGSANSGNVRFIRRKVTDRNTNVETPGVRVAAVSILGFDLQTKNPSYAGTGAFYVNDCVYQSNQALLVPAAIGYSAGMINYILRGQLAVGLPPEGVYGVVDQAVGVGFQKIKLTVANATPDIIAGGSRFPQAMTGGTLVAVVRYHVNICYQADIAGEWGSPGSSPANCRDPVESRSVSSTTLDAAGQTVTTVSLGTNPTGFQFVFNPPIPLGISDVAIQLVYRGALGSETDAVVTTTKNVSEPNWLVFLNASNYIYCSSNGMFSIKSPLQGGQSVDDLRLAFGYSNFGPPYPGTFAPIATRSQLNPGQYVRLGVLGELDIVPFWFKSPSFIVPDFALNPPARNERTSSGYTSSLLQTHYGIHGYEIQFSVDNPSPCLTTPIDTIVEPNNPPVATIVPMNAISSFLP